VITVASRAEPLGAEALRALTEVAEAAARFVRRVAGRSPEPRGDRPAVL
jgi:hypothetical protein